MSIGSVNSPLSLQESQLLQILQQQSAFRAKAQGTDPDTDTAATSTGQNLPGGTDVQQSDSNLDPDLSPQKISALLLALQTQQASLDTTLLLGGASTGNGGSSLVDYLTGNNNVGASNPLAANQLIDDGLETDASTADGEAQPDLNLADYLA